MLFFFRCCLLLRRTHTCTDARMRMPDELKNRQRRGLNRTEVRPVGLSYMIGAICIAYVKRVRSWPRRTPSRNADDSFTTCATTTRYPTAGIQFRPVVVQTIRHRANSLAPILSVYIHLCKLTEAEGAFMQQVFTYFFRRSLSCIVQPSDTKHTQDQTHMFYA